MAQDGVRVVTDNSTAGGIANDTVKKTKQSS
jgi:hypothetical protein